MEMYLAILPLEPQQMLFLQRGKTIEVILQIPWFQYDDWIIVGLEIIHEENVRSWQAADLQYAVALASTASAFNLWTCNSDTPCVGVAKELSRETIVNRESPSGKIPYSR